MNEIALEGFKSLVLGGIVCYIWWISLRRSFRRVQGWWFIVVGFNLIFIGSLFDITDNFESLNRFVIIGDTPSEALFENLIGDLLGASFLLVGFWHWLPTVGAFDKAKQELEVYSTKMGVMVEARTSELDLANSILTEQIKERSKAEARLTESLGEKEILLKEIHHRVKNNLQIISSLLSLQSKYIEDEKALSNFQESQTRVRSMALIHEKLYQSADLVSIDFAEYLESLVLELARSYRLNPLSVSIDLNIAEAMFDVDTAIPCGLIVNELVTNSLKYAFPDNRKGVIQINLDSHGDRFTLVVKDDGIGFPEHVDWQNTESLGMQLVNTLTSQLGGSVELNDSSGTEFKITFSEKSHARKV